MKIFEFQSLEKNAIEKKSLLQGQKVKVEPNQPYVWLIIEGKADLNFVDKKENSITAGQILFLSPGISCTIAIYKPFSFFSFCIPTLTGIIQELYPEGLEKEKVSFNQTFNPLQMNKVLWEYSRHLDDVLDNCKPSTILNSLQSYHLLFLLKETYSKQLVSRFFYPIIPSLDSFVLTILENEHHTKSVYKLALLCNQSIRTFERNFKKAFGVSPGKWLLERRVKKVYEEIVHNQDPLVVVADKCGFTTLSQLSDFCKKYIGTSPSKLRKGSTR